MTHEKIDPDKIPLIDTNRLSQGNKEKAEEAEAEKYKAFGDAAHVPQPPEETEDILIDEDTPLSTPEIEELENALEKTQPKRNPKDFPPLTDTEGLPPTDNIG